MGMVLATHHAEPVNAIAARAPKARCRTFLLFAGNRPSPSVAGCLPIPQSSSTGFAGRSECGTTALPRRSAMSPG